MTRITGKQKVTFSQRLGDSSWRELATYLDIPNHEVQWFTKGSEGRDILTWLEQRNRVDELPEALNIIDRNDLAMILQPPPDFDPTTPRWPGSPYPGLLAFSSEQAPIFCGRDRQVDELVDWLRDPGQRFIAVVGDSGSGKSSVVAAGVLGKRAAETYAALHPTSQDALGTVFKELVEVDAERGVATRKRAPLQRFDHDAAALDLINALTEARLLVRSNPENVPTVEVAHEALLRHWELLRNWIEARFDDFRLLRQVKLAVAEWERHERESHYL
jgi:hypothetical protein